MHFDAVNDNFNVVCLVAVHHHAKLNLSHFTIDAYTGEACLTDMLKQLPIMTFSATDSWSQNIDAFAIELVQNQVSDLIFGVAHHLLSRVIGIGLADSGVEQAQEVIDFGDGAHRRARVFVH